MTSRKNMRNGVLTLLAASVTFWASGPALAQARPADKAAAGKSVKIDMNKIFPPGPGRNLVLSDCTSCHTITPIVIIQMTREARERWARDHRERVNAMSNEDFKVVTEYLIRHFSPGQPIPQLPKELLDTWTSY